MSTQEPGKVKIGEDGKIYVYRDGEYIEVGRYLKEITSKFSDRDWKYFWTSTGFSIKPGYVRDGRTYERLRYKHIKVRNAIDRDKRQFMHDEGTRKVLMPKREFVPDSVHERRERTDSVEKELRTFKEDGSPRRDRKTRPTEQGYDRHEGKDGLFDPRPKRQCEVEQAMERERYIEWPDRFDPWLEPARERDRDDDTPFTRDRSFDQEDRR